MLSEELHALAVIQPIMLEREVYSKVPVNVQVCMEGTILCVAAVASGVNETQYNLLPYNYGVSRHKHERTGRGCMENASIKIIRIQWG